MRRHRNWVAGRRSERGAALVEAAIVLPLVLLLTFGALEFGFALSDASGLRSSVRSGARIGAALSRQPTQLPSIVDAVNEGLKSISFANVTDLLVYTGDKNSVTQQVTDCTIVSFSCVDLNPSSRNHFDLTSAAAATLAANWQTNVVSSEDACVGTAWKLGVTVVADYPGVTKLASAPHKFTATMLIDLEPTISSSCRG